MHNYYFLMIWFLLLAPMALVAQMQDSLAQNSVLPDDQVLKMAEEMPRFPGCEQLLYPPERKKCAENSMLRYIYQNISYPDTARAMGIEGSVVINFVVEKDGSISSGKIMKEIGGGCGEEALRVVNLMNEQEIKWIPGKQNGEAVRVAFNLPIKFKLEQEPDFSFIDGDTVYTNIDEALQFTGGPEVLDSFINSSLNYPQSGIDSCYAGSIEVDALVFPDGLVKAVNIIDFANLGIDFQFAAIELVTETMGMWTPAQLGGRGVPTTYPIRLTFKPPTAACKRVADQFTQAEQLLTEGVNLYAEGASIEAIAKLDKAISLFPENGEFLYSRGMIYMNENKFEEACGDLTKAKAILGTASMVDQLIPIICR